MLPRKFQSLCHHHFHELFVINLTVAINISFPDHFINFFIGQLFAKICHHMAQLGRANEAVAIPVEDLKCFNQFLLCIGIFHFPCHERKKLWEINCTISISVHFINMCIRVCVSLCVCVSACVCLPVSFSVCVCLGVCMYA